MGIQVHTSNVAGNGGEVSNTALGRTSSKTTPGVDTSDSSNGDTVSLSGVSNLIALAKADGTSPDRQAKIDNLTTLVRSGQYQANPSDVSRAMVHDLIVG